jgi:hypothetical protein
MRGKMSFGAHQDLPPGVDLLETDLPDFALYLPKFVFAK